MRQSWYFAGAIFVSAFLLFQLQPVISKYFLPWFGGGFSVWTTAELFFQVLLVGGYLYAFWMNRYPLKTQGKVHAILMAAALAWIVLSGLKWGTPLMPDSSLKPNPGGFAIGQVLLVLLVSVGLPFFLLSTTSSLIQSWFSRLFRLESPYTFYVLSNAASLLALLSYPFLFEPNLSLHQQALFWVAGFGVFLLVMAYGVVKVRACPEEMSGDVVTANRLTQAEVNTLMSDGESQPASSRALGLINLAMVGSVLLLATTNQMTQDVASVPFLWVLPLSLYLLSFMLAFTRFIEKRRGWLVFWVILALFTALLLLADPGPMPVWLQITANSFVMFTGCLLVHSELYRRRS